MLTRKHGVIKGTLWTSVSARQLDNRGQDEPLFECRGSRGLVGGGAAAGCGESCVPFPQEPPHGVRNMLCELVRARERLVGTDGCPVMISEVEHVVNRVAHDKL